MNKEELQDALTLKIREMLDPMVVDAGYDPEDYDIVWNPIESSINMGELNLSDEDIEKLKEDLGKRRPSEDEWVRGFNQSPIEEEP